MSSILTNNSLNNLKQCLKKQLSELRPLSCSDKSGVTLIRIIKAATNFNSKCLEQLRSSIALLHLHKTVTGPMAHPMPSLLSRRLFQQPTTFRKISSPLSRRFRAPIHKSPARRTYATGESGPNPKPGQNPFKIWPFIAITLAGSGAYVLMVKSRAGKY